MDFQQNWCRFHSTDTAVTSASFLAEISVSSPRKIIIFIIWKKHFLDQNIRKIFYLILRKEALPVTQVQGHDLFWSFSRICQQRYMVCWHVISDGTAPAVACNKKVFNVIPYQPAAHKKCMYGYKYIRRKTAGFPVNYCRLLGQPD